MALTTDEMAKVANYEKLVRESLMGKLQEFLDEFPYVRFGGGPIGAWNFEGRIQLAYLHGGGSSRVLEDATHRADYTIRTLNDEVYLRNLLADYDRLDIVP